MMTDASGNTFAGKETLLEWKELNQLSGRIWRSITSPTADQQDEVFPSATQHGVPGDPQFGSGIKIGRDEWKFSDYFRGRQPKNWSWRWAMGDGAVATTSFWRGVDPVSGVVDQKRPIAGVEWNECPETNNPTMILTWNSTHGVTTKHQYYALLATR